MGTMVIVALLLVWAALSIRKILIDRKNGKSIQCGGDCSKCSGCRG